MAQESPATPAKYPSLSRLNVFGTKAGPYLVWAETLLSHHSPSKTSSVFDLIEKVQKLRVTTCGSTRKNIILPKATINTSPQCYWKALESALSLVLAFGSTAACLLKLGYGEKVKITKVAKGGERGTKKGEQGQSPCQQKEPTERRPAATLGNPPAEPVGVSVKT